MKLLIISDIHSNIWALDSILKKEREFDLVCCAGDLTDYGTVPCEVIDRVTGFERALIVQGNHDTHMARTYREGAYRQVAPEAYKWVHHNCRQLDEERVSRLEELPMQVCFEADGYVYLMSHQYDHAYGVIQSRGQFEQFWQEHVPEQYAKSAKRRMIFGHTHRQCIHILGDDMLWINPGSVSYRRPDDPDKTAHYAVIEDGQVSLRQVAYDRSPLLAEAEKLNRARGMMEKELQDFYFFFGDAETSRDPLPGRT